MSPTDRIVHCEEDSYRLPEGFRRIGYDGDSKRYTFRDNQGDIYQGEPGVLYGKMTPLVPSNSAFEAVRPQAFEDETRPTRRSTAPSAMTDVPTTFQDILPPELITTSSLSANPSYAVKRSASPKSSSAFVASVRKSALPKMQGVVHGLRRSVTSMRRSKMRGVSRLPDDVPEDGDDMERLTKKSEVKDALSAS
ncbi:hypothetical protein D9619_009723 [Psilocybe cf. subviscida]|uniref:Carbohydrate-binding module family 50 protein n=1 Tax=Psilocybe cf. subviscida TaxID=2480587 RepID=A0A8H5BLU6_9AGAR|nr:hypothetical protein D9619_009723 [Psilocybe cf. subviscida]